VDGHELDAVVTGYAGVGFGIEILKRGVERGAQKILLAVGETIETIPEEVEISSCRSIGACLAAKAKPDLLEPGAQ